MCAHPGCEAVTSEYTPDEKEKDFSTDLNHTMYKCVRGHLLDTCDTRDTLSYAEIGRRVLDKVSFLLKVHSCCAG